MDFQWEGLATIGKRYDNSKAPIFKIVALTSVSTSTRSAGFLLAPLILRNFVSSSLAMASSSALDF